MLIGNDQITREQMPSFVSPMQQPYHMYQSMQDVLQAGLQSNPGVVQPQQPVQSTIENRSNQWNG